MDRRPGPDSDAIFLVNHLVLLHVIEFMHLDLTTRVRQRARAGRDVPLVGHLHAFYEGLAAQFRRGTTGSIKVYRRVPARKPAADVQTHEIANVVNMQMAGKNLIELGEVRSQRKKVTHRTQADIEQELVAVTEFNQVGYGYSAFCLIRHAGTERDNAHLVGSQLFSIGKVAGRIHTIGNFYRAASFGHCIGALLCGNIASQP